MNLSDWVGWVLNVGLMMLVEEKLTSDSSYAPDHAKAGRFVEVLNEKAKQHGINLK